MWLLLLVLTAAWHAECAVSHHIIRGVVYFGAWHGLSNQRQCIINALRVAERLGYAVLLPQLRLNFLANNADDHLVPFRSLYKVSKLRKLARKHNITLLEHPSQLPDNLLYSCLSQLARTHGPWPPVADHISRNADFWCRVFQNTQRKTWPRTMCVDDVTSYTASWALEIEKLPLQNNVSPDQLLSLSEVDAAIEASSLIDKEIDGIVDAVEEQYGTRSFVSVHVRTEGDWVAYCLAMDRQDLSTSCFVDDKEIGKFLREDEKLPRNTLIFVSSGHAPLPSLCAGFRCFRAEDVWLKRSAFFQKHPVRELYALVDYNLAMRGEAFFGNNHSTFTKQLSLAFARMHRINRVYNTDCKEGEDCRGVPDVYKVPECLNTHDIVGCEAAVQVVRTKMIEEHLGRVSKHGVTRS